MASQIPVLHLHLSQPSQSPRSTEQRHRSLGTNFRDPVGLTPNSILKMALDLGYLKREAGVTFLSETETVRIVIFLFFIP